MGYLTAEEIEVAIAAAERYGDILMKDPSVATCFEWIGVQHGKERQLCPHLEVSKLRGWPIVECDGDPVNEGRTCSYTVNRETPLPEGDEWCDSQDDLLLTLDLPNSDYYYEMCPFRLAQLLRKKLKEIDRD